MCAHYKPANKDQLANYFHVDPREYEFKPDAFPGYMAPIIRPLHGDLKSDQVETIAGMFGMVPHWAETKFARSTYNSRSETTATKPSFRNAWKHRQFCIIPAAAIYEPCYETGKAVKWEIRRVSGEPMGIAGIWEVKHGQGDAPDLVSFSMLTVNADEHQLMKRFHKPEDEKRSVVILHPEQYEAWMYCSLEDAPEFLKLFPAKELEASPA